MPTLEDVFLNIGSVRLEEEEMLQSGKVDEEKNERILFKQKYIKDFTKTEKFLFDAVALLKKRFFQIIRDTKTFMLEIICPILLVLVGCLVVQIDIFEDSKPILCNEDSLASFGKQVIYYGDIDNRNTFYQYAPLYRDRGRGSDRERLDRKLRDGRLGRSPDRKKRRCPHA